jgi:hypothetical protein
MTLGTKGLKYTKELELVLLKNYSPDIGDQMQDCHCTNIPGGGKAMLPGFEIVLHFHLSVLIDICGSSPC